ncbi:MAG: sulfite exporter TauE/SafE family protein [Burkholderiales bacterium]|nr:MAG: sulfite exporter TauE/SafE family protein [Burkholderiales bacterium]
MSLFVLLATAASLGLLGGLHCVAMCSALQRVAVHGLGGSQAAAPRTATAIRRIPLQPVDAVSGRPLAGALPRSDDLAFHAARLLGYAALGAAVGSGSWLLRWGSDAMPLMRPLWGTLNVGLLALGLALLVLGRQPAWIDALGVRAWRAGGSRLGASVGRGRPWVAGAAWALVPCGLLYSALATAALASDPMRGALAMLAFGAGTSVHLLGAQWLMNVLARGSSARAARVETIGMRIGGALLAAMAVAALLALSLGQPHPFCAS